MAGPEAAPRIGGAPRGEWGTAPSRRLLPTLGERLQDALYAAIRPLMRVALAVHFRTVHVSHRERFPENGAVLLVANHPSTWADVLVLYEVFGRRFHFIAESRQFHPW